MVKPSSTIESTDPTVFIDTALDTHLALTITNNDSVLHLKKKIMSEHFQCFPMLGKIDVNAIKVKRKQCFYQLSDSMFVKSVFDGVEGTWFLYVDAVSQVVNPLQLEPGSLPNLKVDGPSSETQKTNIQLDRQCIKDSNNGIANHVILNEIGGQTSDRSGEAPQLKSAAKKKPRKVKKKRDGVSQNIKGSLGEACHPVLAANKDQIVHSLHDPIGESMKEIDAENKLHGKETIAPENLGEAPQLISALMKKQRKVKKKSEDVPKNIKASLGEAYQPALVASRDQIVHSLQPSEEIDLKRKLSEASLDTEAKDVANSRNKKNRSTKLSDGETGLSYSGVGKDDSTSGVVPVTSKHEKALDADHLTLETKKVGT
ncbi:hypothetical protein MKX01_030101 [Papaver californicum]|nr:hypothetical protein MKX01_030101 [Papaver californicum]